MKKLNAILMLLFTAVTAGMAQQQQIVFNLLTAPCNNNGVLEATVPGMSPPITFTWHVAGTTVTNTTGILSNYGGGPVYVTASSGSAAGVTGYYQGAPPFSYTVNTTPAVCPGLGTATVSGVTPPFTVQWMDISHNMVSSSNPASLPAGSYQVLITNSSGCTYGSAARGDSIYIEQTSSVDFTLSTTNAACTNGTASVTNITGGMAPYSYLWSNGANSSSISGLIRGAYNVRVTDAQGCFTTKYAEVLQSVHISVNTTATPATCIQNNGSIIAFATGGTLPYSYVWSNAQTTQTAIGLAGGGSYRVTVTDANGCIGDRSTYLSSTTPITATYTSTASSCTTPDGTATLAITGGATPYTVTWNSFPAQTGNIASSLAPGTYGFNITDNAGCVRNGTVNIPPVSIVLGSVATTPATCTQSNGSATVNIISGTSPYVYSWSNGATTNSISNVPSGYYTCTIHDAQGCSITKQALVNASSPMHLGLTTTNASCIYAADGSITASPAGGTAPYTYSWSNGQSGNTISGLAPGNYYLSVHDAAGCIQNNHSYISYNAGNSSCYCTITGTVYDDQNGNCIMDAGEQGIPNIMIHCSGLGYTFTDANGAYSFKAPSGSYTLSESVQTYYPLAACQSNAVQVSVSAATGCVQTVNFANAINPIHDITVQTVSYSAPPVPGNHYYQSFIISNAGTTTENNILAGYKHDGQLTLSGFSPAYLSTTGATHYQSNNSFPALAPATHQHILMDYLVPANIPLSTSVQYNDSAVYAAPMSNWLSDYTPWNNVSSYQAVVVGSFDPNYKEVSPKGQGPQGYIHGNIDSVLTYTIHFQNTGTYPAQKVVLTDTLNANLNLATLKPGFATHNYTTNVSEGGVVTFTFDNINLPDSISQPLASMGFVSYTIHLKPQLPIGTQITNKAAIYFDYNAPVITNITLNTLDIPTRIPEVNTPGKLSLNVYPNPAGNHVSILVSSANNNAGTIRFMNILGQEMLRQDIRLHEGNNLYSANTSSLAAGIYFIEVSDGYKTGTVKLNVIR